MDICAPMEKDTFTKKYSFRLPDRTIEQLDWLVEHEGFRNRTQAFILIIEGYMHFVRMMEQSENVEIAFKKMTDEEREQLDRMFPQSYINRFLSPKSKQDKENVV